MKDTYYFPHDYEPTADPKIQALLGEFGATGYGIFWRIIEMLHSDSSHKLPHKKFIYLALAKQMQTSVEQIETIVKFAIDTCELLQSDGEYFWSNRVNRNIEKRAEISKIRSKAGKQSAYVKQVSTNVEQKTTNGNKGKESKGKEKKDSNNALSIVEYPSVEEIRKHLEWYYDRSNTSFKNCKSKDMANIAERYFNSRESMDWRKNGNRISRWKFDAQNFAISFDERFVKSKNDNIDEEPTYVKAPEGWK